MNDRELAKQNAAQIAKMRGFIEKYTKRRELEQQNAEALADLQGQLEHIARQSGVSLTQPEPKKRTKADIFLP